MPIGFGRNADGVYFRCVNVSPPEHSPSGHSRAALIRLWIAVVMLGVLTAFTTFVLRPHRWEAREVPGVPR